ncbi:hypothetical protein BB560_000516 [Smittium megazygosporum]|uniref:Coiled-coil domain-containing protein n=1 Tax=Smittium megazygosporum TaxID=133381 RepID=A0A2T9ZK94_9FUNG|nr:hypothetical protein BB560_000516 [Smittium megazygosporum]
MAKKFKGENSKVTAAKQKKALVNEEKIRAKQAQLEKSESEKWATGAKKSGKKDLDEAKRLEKLEKKKQLEEMLKMEEASIVTAKAKTQPTKLFPKTVKPKAPVRGEEKKAASKQIKANEASSTFVEVASFSASGVDNALDLFEYISIEDSESSQLASTVNKSSTLSGIIDRHPERRHKAAFKVYEERELPIIKEQNKGLRLQQQKEILWKQWQKSPENPFNQSQVTYNASQTEMSEAINQHASSIKERLSTK